MQVSVSNDGGEDNKESESKSFTLIGSVSSVCRVTENFGESHLYHLLQRKLGTSFGVPNLINRIIYNTDLEGNLRTILLAVKGKPPEQESCK